MVAVAATLSCADSLGLVSSSNKELQRVMLMRADPTGSTHRKQTDEVTSCYSYTLPFSDLGKGEGACVQ